MSYLLKECSFDGSGSDISKPIEDYEAQILMREFSYLGINMRSYYYYQIVKRNLVDLVSFIDSQQNRIKGIDKLECNRLLFNYVDTFYAYINYFEKNYKEEFSVIKKQIYENYFEYRFTYNLRNYMIHNDLGVLSHTAINYGDTLKITFNVSKEAFIKSKNIQASFKEEIQKLPNKDWDIFPIINKHFEIIKGLQEKMLIAISENILSKFHHISSLIINQHATFLEENGRIVNDLLGVTTKFYKCIASNFVYEENYLKTKNQINDIFMKLSFFYYKEPNVVFSEKA